MQGAALKSAAKWPYLEAPSGFLNRWHKLDAVIWWLDPYAPVCEFNEPDEDVLVRDEYPEGSTTLERLQAI